MVKIDLLARICKLVDRKKFDLICFPRLIYCDQEPLLLLNLTVHLFGCTYKAISTRYKICFTPKSLNFSMEASLLAVAKSIYYISSLICRGFQLYFLIITRYSKSQWVCTLWNYSIYNDINNNFSKQRMNSRSKLQLNTIFRFCMYWPQKEISDGKHYLF